MGSDPEVNLEKKILLDATPIILLSQGASTCATGMIACSHNANKFGFSTTVKGCRHSAGALENCRLNWDSVPGPGPRL